MATATERYRILQNIIAQKGIEADLFAELARAEAMINGIEQGRMMPPPIPEDLSQSVTPPAQAPQEPLNNEIPPM